MFPVEGIKLNLQEPELSELLDLPVGKERVSGQKSEGLQVVAVLGEELDGLNVLPAVRDGEADQVLGEVILSSPATLSLSHLVSLVEFIQSFLARPRPLVDQIQVFTILIVIVVEEGILKSNT